MGNKTPELWDVLAIYNKNGSELNSQNKKMYVHVIIIDHVRYNMWVNTI